MRPTYAEIDLAAIRHNTAALAALVAPAEVCTVVKADGYGHGDVPVAEAALEAGAPSLAVALLEEGVRLREAGIEAPILVLSEPDTRDAAELLQWGLTPTVYRAEFLAALAAVGKEAQIHVKIDTGMHRVGATIDGLSGLIDRVVPPLTLEAVWTHFAVADEDPLYTALQIERFRAAVAGLEVRTHLANTAGAVLFPEARGDMVRAGLGTYGLHPCPDTAVVLELQPAMRVVSRVAHLQRLPEGERPSYGRRRPLEAEATVVTIPIGYADGIPRRLSALGGEVLIRGRRHQLAGTVTMDQTMVDVGDTDVAVGDEVVLLGRQDDAEIGADEWAEMLETISYEIVCGIGPRVPRRYRG